MSHPLANIVSRGKTMTQNTPAPHDHPTPHYTPVLRPPAVPPVLPPVPLAASAGNSWVPVLGAVAVGGSVHSASGWNPATPATSGDLPCLAWADAEGGDTP